MCVLEFGNKDANGCTMVNDFVPNHITIPLSGELETNIDNCTSQVSACFKTKDWIYDTDFGNGFYANRMIGEDSPYWLTIVYSDGSITCHNNDTTSKDYCKMLCGGDRCAL